jgi:hypothetical protein
MAALSDTRRLRMQRHSLFVRVSSASIGTGLTEGVFANRLGLAFDLRAFELDLGAALTGTTFKESFSANGLAAMVGLKFGW